MVCLSVSSSFQSIRLVAIVLVLIDVVIVFAMTRISRQKIETYVSIILPIRDRKYSNLLLSRPVKFDVMSLTPTHFEVTQPDLH